MHGVMGKPRGAAQDNIKDNNIATSKVMLLMLVVMTGVAPISLYMLVPALPVLATDFGRDISIAQMTVSLYMVGIALSQLIMGPLSDKFGRRPVLLAGLGLAALALLFTPLRLALALLLLFKALLLGAFARQGGLFQTLAFDGRIGLRRLRRLGNHGRRLRRYRRGQGQQLLLNLRRQDLLCRLAGDRFVALLPGTGAQQAQQIAGELQDAVRHLAYRSSRNGERLRLSASVASVLAQDEDGESLLRRLNLALAHAKQAPAVKRA